MDEREQAWLYTQTNRDATFINWWFLSTGAAEYSDEENRQRHPEWAMYTESYYKGSGYWKSYPWSKLPDSVRVVFLESVVAFTKAMGSATTDPKLILRVEAALLEYDLNRAAKILGRNKFNALQNNK